MRNISHRWLCLFCLIWLIQNIQSFSDPYIWADAVSMFGIKQALYSDIHVAIVQDLRPGFGLIMVASSQLLANGFPLGLLFFIGAFGNLISAALLRKYLSDLNLPLIFQVLIPVGLLTLPSFQNYARDVVMWSFNWLIALILITFLLPRRKSRLILFIFSVILITLTYPPLLGLIVIFLATKDLASIAQLSNGKSTTEAKLNKKLISPNYLTALFLSSSTTVLLAFIYAIRSVGDVSDRTDLLSSASEIKDKLIWISTTLFGTYMRPWALSTTPIALFLSISISLCIVLYARPALSKLNSRDKLICMVYFPFLCLLSCGPQLLVSQNQFEFRSLPGLSLGGLIWLTSLSSLGANFRKSQSFSVFRRVVAGTIIGLATLNSYNAGQQLWSKPTAARDEVLERTLKVTQQSEFCQVIPESLRIRDSRLGVYSLRSDLALLWVQQTIIPAFLGLSSPSEVEVVSVFSVDDCPVDFQVVNFSLSLPSKNKIPIY